MQILKNQMEQMLAPASKAMMLSSLAAGPGAARGDPQAMVTRAYFDALRTATARAVRIVAAQKAAEVKR